MPPAPASSCRRASRRCCAASSPKPGPSTAKKAPSRSRARPRSAASAWVKAKLVDHGRARAESLGWTDVYTLTKAFAERAAEQMWAARGHRLSFVRPAIVESALRHPYPGWIDGFKVADPLIMAYGRGMLPEFPGVPDSVLDVVPVDFVVNVIVLVASNPAAAGEPQFFHVSSGASNPLPIHRMFTNLSMFFTANPLPTADSGSIAAATWRFPGGRKVERAVRLQARLNDARESVFLRLPSTDRTREALAGVDRRRADLESLQSLTDLYRHYIQSEIIFDDRRTKALQAALVATQPAEVSRRHRLRHDRHPVGGLLPDRALPRGHDDDPGVQRSARLVRPRARPRAAPSATTSWRSSISRAPSSTRTSSSSTSGCAAPASARRPGPPRWRVSSRRFPATFAPNSAIEASSFARSSVDTRACP